MPSFDFEAGSMSGATGMILEEILGTYPVLAGLPLPAPVLTTTIPRP